VGALPTFSYSPGNISGGAIVAHGNLFGQGKRGVIGGRISNVDSGALAAYEDPAVWGSWIFFTVKGSTNCRSFPNTATSTATCQACRCRRCATPSCAPTAADINVGVAWFRKVRTSVGWIFDQNDVLWSAGNSDNSFAKVLDLPAGAASGRRGAATANVTFDFRARQHAVMYGNALGFSLEVGGTRWGGDAKLNYWEGQHILRHGIRFFRRHNLIVRAGGTAGDNLPLWTENSPAAPTCAAISIGNSRATRTCAPRSSTTSPLLCCGDSTFAVCSSTTLPLSGFASCRRSTPSPTPTSHATTARQSPAYLHQGFVLQEDLHSFGGRGRAFLFADRSHATRRCGRGQRPGHQGCAHDSGSRRLGSMWQITNRSQALILDGDD